MSRDLEWTHQQVKIWRERTIKSFSMWAGPLPPELAAMLAELKRQQDNDE